ncbi:hypothetical protein FACS189413_08100 [Bacteroidia bacterium]|nr:hypothetical protein FACS189413_08100 [Bacteroidia bacterium]
MSKRFFSIMIFLTAVMTVSFGQAVPFLNSFSDARTAAMGHAGYVLPSAFAVHRNTAAMMSGYAPATEVAISYLLWQPQSANTSLINAGGYTRFNNFGLAAGFRYNTMPAIEKTDEHGNAMGTFAPSEYVAEAGLAYKINSVFSAGAAFRYIVSDMGGAKKGAAFAADISLLYNHKNLSAGLGLSNFGSKIGYGSSAYGLPTRINGGGAYCYSMKEKHALTGVLDVAYQLSSGYAGLASGIGAEYTYNDFVSARTGYHLESNPIGSSYATLGCGVHFAGFVFDFAYLIAGNNNPMSQTMIFSLVAHLK